MENNDSLKQRLVGAAVLISLVVIFLPMLVDDGPGPSPDRPAVPTAPEWDIGGWKGKEYQPPTLPQQPVREVIDPGPVGVTGVVAKRDGVSPGNDGNGGGVAQPVAGEQRGGSAMVAGPERGADGSAQSSAQRMPGDLLEATVKTGDTLYGIFRDLGLDPSQVREVVNVDGAREPLSRLRPGQRLRIRVDENKRIVAMEYLHGGGPALRIKRVDGQLQGVSVGEAGSKTPRVATAPSKPAASSSVARPAPNPASEARPNRQQGPVAWAVQIGVYKDWDAARGVQSGLRDKGYPAFLKSQDKDGVRVWNLKVGPELKQSDAVALAQKIQQETGSKTQVVGYP
jgi:DedD protein